MQELASKTYYLEITNGKYVMLRLKNSKYQLNL